MIYTTKHNNIDHERLPKGNQLSDVNMKPGTSTRAAMVVVVVAVHNGFPFRLGFGERGGLGSRLSGVGHRP